MLTVLTFGSLVGAPAATPAPGDDIDAYIAEHREAHDVPGIAYAVVEEGEVVHQGTDGTDGDGDPIAPGTPFLIGSVSKTFTALAVMQLAAAGTLDLDRPVRDILPWFTLDEEEAAGRITVRHLLTHTSGISEATGLAVADRFDDEPGAIERAARDLAGSEPLDEPGATYEYSSGNYLVLGALVEEVSGTPFDTHLEETVLAPLRMSDAVVTTSDRLPPGHRLAFGRAWEFDPGYDASGLPYGYLGASLTDLTRLVEAELAGGRLSGEQVLDPAVVRLTQEPREDVAADSYRYGWREGELDGVRTLWRSGATPGYFATVLLVPDEEVGVVVLQNAYSPARDAQLNEAASNVLRILRGEATREVGADPLLTWTPWALVVLALVVVGAAGVSARRSARGGATRGRSVRWVVGSVALGVLVALLPGLLGADWRRAWLWTPDIAVGIVMVLVACALGAACHAVLLVRSRRRVGG